MKILYGLIYEMDTTMQGLYAFMFGTIVVLAILHAFMKKHIKIWSALCLIPLIAYGVFLSQGCYVGNSELTVYRYSLFGVMAVIIALWGLAILLKRSYVAYTIILVIFSVIFFFVSIVEIWAVFLRPNVANYSHLGWTQSFEKTIDYMEQEYVLNDWKEIDYARIREELIPKVKEAEANGDEVAFAAAVYELKYEFHDGHVSLRGDTALRDAAISKLAGNDYGLSMFRIENGNVIAIEVDEDSACDEAGIHNGTVITKWNGVPVEEAAEQVKCIDRIHDVQTWENIHMVQPIFLAGQGGDQVEVTFIDEEGTEKTAKLGAEGEYYGRRTRVLEKLYGNNIISHDNYSTGMLNENVGYLRITDEEYSTNPIFITKNTIKCYSQEMNDDLDGRLEEMRQQGMDRIIIDIRNNNGGYGFESRTVASLFTEKSIPYLLVYDKDGEYIVASEAEDVQGGKWSDMPVVLMVNAQTCSAGEELTYFLKGSENVTVMGNSSTWGAAQSTGGSVVLSDSLVEMRFPILPTVGEDMVPIVDPKADYHSRMGLDYQIDYSKEEALDLFSDKVEDRDLEEAIEYIQNLD